MTPDELFSQVSFNEKGQWCNKFRKSFETDNNLTTLSDEISEFLLV